MINPNNFKVKSKNASSTNATAYQDAICIALNHQDGEAKEKIHAGIAAVDDKLDGGFLKGSKIIIAGAPGVGKTTLVSQFAECFAMQRYHILYFSTEMTPEQLAATSISRASYLHDPQSAVTSSDVLENNVDLPDKLIDSMQECVCVGDGSYTIIGKDSWHHQAEEVEAFLASFSEDELSKVIIIVDYIQDLTADVPADTGNKEIVDHSIRVLKQIADTYGVTLIMVSAVHRDFYSDSPSCTAMPSLRSLRDSSALEYTADTVIILRDKKAWNDISVRPVSLSIAKNKYGPTGKEDLTFIAKHHYFSDSEDLPSYGNVNDSGEYECDFLLR